MSANKVVFISLMILKNPPMQVYCR